ncbi:MAG: VWA domain-containing protein, partial [Acidobacteriota bacterium]|nr:VWA domain-containing protein [Acidobacteriota bacterium]
MRSAWLAAVLLPALVSLGFSGPQAVQPTLRITSPAADDIIAGSTRLQAVIAPPESVQSVTFYVDGRVVCTVERPPFGCAWDPGSVVRAHHVRVVAMLADKRRLVANLHTKDLGYAERVRTEAVLVPVIVTNGGQFVRGLKQQDFEVFEDGVRQPVASFVNEDAKLDLVLAVDVSGSMEGALDGVKAAVRQLLSKLRTGDAATLVGFNDTVFIAAERETDARVRDEAVNLLTSWGGTALYDATIRTLNMVSRDWGRKGVVIFSDGDDQNS